MRTKDRDRDLRTLEGWLDFCRRNETAREDQAIMGTSWVLDRITPPPVRDPASVRLPLERARDCEGRALQEQEPQRKRDLYREALRWLDHPHPDTSDQFRRIIKAERQRVQKLLLHLED